MTLDEIVESPPEEERSSLEESYTTCLDLLDEADTMLLKAHKFIRENCGNNRAAKKMVDDIEEMSLECQMFVESTK